MDPIFQLLAACACLEVSSETGFRIKNAAAGITNWEEVLIEAEEQRMSPLLYLGLKNAGVSLEADLLHRLKALTLRHRLINQVRQEVLAQVVSAAGAAGLAPLVVKGAALAQVVYPDPGLRPMADIDLLVSPGQLDSMQKLLKCQGFNETVPAEYFKNHRHLPSLSKKVQGFQISIEVHHSLFSFTPGRHWGGRADFIRPPLAFQIGSTGVCAYTLGLEDLIMQLCAHMNQKSGSYEPFRMIWAADIQAFLGKFGSQTDWSLVRAQYPGVINTLEQLNYLAPLPADFCAQINLFQKVAPDGVGEPYTGWPNMSLLNLRGTGLGEFIRKTFLPSDWWLKLYYGKSLQGWRWAAIVKHAAHLVALGWRHFRLRLTA